MTDAHKLTLIVKELDELKRLAALKTNRELYSDYSPGDNGNADDAYGDGYADAEIHMARRMLRMIQDV